MSTLKKLSTLLLLASASSHALASSDTDKKFNDLLEKYKINPKEEQSYCYLDAAAKTQGLNVDKKVRIASVTKLITSLWSAKKLGVNFTHDTVLYLKDGHLHIQGSFDPFMSNEKMIYLISSLNQLGITELKKITFDDAILINPNAQFYSDKFPVINEESNKKWLTLYFNTETWTSSLKADYVKYSNLAPEGRYVKNPSFKVEEIAYSQANPFNLKKGNQVPASVRVLTLKSPPLYKYLKEINVKSNNYGAHTLFENLGGSEQFKIYAKNQLGLNSDEIGIYNGSGLPTVIQGTRFDNFATCRIVMNLSENLRTSAQKQGKELEDIVAVPGNDAGTFKNRLNTSDLKNTLVAKTGTLMHTSSLAGALSTKSGYSYFGVFNQTENINDAKTIQNEMVKNIFEDMGGSKNFNYTVEDFLPYDKNNILKHLELEEDQSEIFSEIDGGLVEL